MRINLAAAFVRHPDFLFLDEPTNHLDMGMLEWLEEDLRSIVEAFLWCPMTGIFWMLLRTGIHIWKIIRLIHIVATTRSSQRLRPLMKKTSGTGV